MLESFEIKVLKGLQKCGVNFELSDCDDFSLGVAVSGGADSVSLLYALAEISLKYNFSLKVITVNHNIRSKKESGGDADFVFEQCKKLQKMNYRVCCFVEEIPEGLVHQTAETRGGGEEDAARFLRYNLFDSFIEKNNIKYLCLAHNKNDQLETLLMRFLQGNSCTGIARVRGKYIRPLLDVSRNEIEEYLTGKNLEWRTDSTNLNRDYYRNKLRLDVIPFLQKELPGWESGVLSGVEKSSIDAKALEAMADNVEFYFDGEQSFIELEKFLAVEEALQLRVLLRMCNKVSCAGRVPFVFLTDVLEALKKKKECFKYYADIEICYKNNKVFVKKTAKTQTDLCFFDIIEETGKYSFPFGIIEVKTEENGLVKIHLNGELIDCKLDFPFCVRNFQAGDSVLTASGNFKKVTDIYSDWKVPEEKRMLIPIICNANQAKTEIQCIFGSVLGFYDWIVKE